MIAHQPTFQGSASQRGRRGTGTLDLLVAFTLLMTAMSAATPLVVRYHRLVKSHRNYRVALDELTNQLDRLTILPADELPMAAQQLSPSTFANEQLRGVKLTGDLQSADSGSRITLQISWDETGRVHAPIKLSGWVFNKPAPAAVTPEEVAP